MTAQPPVYADPLPSGKNSCTSSMWMDQFLDIGKTSLSHTVTPPQQPKAMLTADLQISSPYPWLLLVPKVACPKMTRPAALGTTQTSRSTKAPISASTSSLQVQSLELQHLTTGRRGGTRPPLAPVVPAMPDPTTRAQVGESGLPLPVWHTQEKQPPGLPSQPRSRASDSAPHPKMLSINFINPSPLGWSLWIVRQYWLMISM